jgi:hypothetical protein
MRLDLLWEFERITDFGEDRVLVVTRVTGRGHSAEALKAVGLEE